LTTQTEAIRFALSARMARRSLVVAAIVGTILNLINQGDALAAPETLDWGKALLTYAVPFCVATWGAYAARRAGG
jgi:hypothetical protein